MTIYDINVRTITGEDMTLSAYRGKVMIIVNTASKCGFTSQLKQLQELYDTYREEGLEILGFPCNQFMNQEPGNEAEIQEFCVKTTESHSRCLRKLMSMEQTLILSSHI